MLGYKNYITNKALSLRYWSKYETEVFKINKKIVKKKY